VFVLLGIDFSQAGDRYPTSLALRLNALGVCGARSPTFGLCLRADWKRRSVNLIIAVIAATTALPLEMM
jgi:hypothetical protein